MIVGNPTQTVVSPDECKVTDRLTRARSPQLSRHHRPRLSEHHAREILRQSGCVRPWLVVQPSYDAVWGDIQEHVSAALTYTVSTGLRRVRLPECAPQNRCRCRPGMQQLS